MKVHCGFNSSGGAGSSFEGLPGLIITVGFVIMLLCVYLPPNASNLFLLLFMVIEMVASLVYVLIGRRNLRESERLRKQLHRINE